MKTAISIPDETYHRMERLAHELGVSRSQFFTTAARRYADELESGATTRAIDSLLHDVADDVAEASGYAVAVGRRVVTAGSDDW